MKWIIYWTVDMKSSKAMILTVMDAIAKIASITVRIIALLSRLLSLSILSGQPVCKDHICSLIMNVQCVLYCITAFCSSSFPFSFRWFYHVMLGLLPSPSMCVWGEGGGGGAHGGVARICLPLEYMQSPFQELATNIGISWMF